MALTDSIVAVADYLKDLIEDNKTTLGVQDVYYGDQERIPRTPSVCVEPNTMNRELSGGGAMRKTETITEVYILVYHSDIRSAESNRRDADALGEAIQTLIHTHPRLGDLMIHGMVEAVESGYGIKGNSKYRATRLTYRGKSQVHLPMTEPD